MVRLQRLQELPQQWTELLARRRAQTRSVFEAADFAEAVGARAPAGRRPVRSLR
ncbi:hypothetical protein F442_14038 [Phytophthora nicotianae P10297]|uniref:Uncharacterized protein n=1 Tax=Phytophthora nicotianae P10297 TaxID=1317064 RepID=W2YUA4_PHYNI|nr:hypothetical protein F442_14038 [Phytophthora nicotianae P10297]